MPNKLSTLYTLIVKSETFVQRLAIFRFLHKRSILKNGSDRNSELKSDSDVHKFVILLSMSHCKSSTILHSDIFSTSYFERGELNLFNTHF